MVAGPKKQKLNYEYNKFDTTPSSLPSIDNKISEEIKNQPEEKTLFEEASNTLKNEGVNAFIEQAANKISNIWAENTGGKEDIIVNSGKIISENEFYKSVTQITDDKYQWEPLSMPDITLLSKEINDKEHKDIIYQPLAVNTEKNKFGYRNRGEYEDIESKGALFSTYNPFRSVSNYIGHNEVGFGKDSLNNENDNVIALNTKTGKVYGGKFKDFKNNNDIVVSRTLPAKDVTDILINQNNKYFEGIAQKGIKLKKQNGKYVNVPIGLGQNGKGESITGWSGGKMFITKPDGTEGHFVYGTAKQLKEQLKLYKKIHSVDYVKWYDMDHKAFSQTYQTKSGILHGEYNRQRDNTNSSGGHFLYLL